MAGKRPNIVYILLDTVRALNLSCCGYRVDTTPNLRRFADQSNTFTNAISPGVWTIPSHASLFTGTYPSRHGALNLNRRLDGRFPTLAGILSYCGYQTVCFSNNFFITLPQFGLSRGFEVVAGQHYPQSRILRAAFRAYQRINGSFDSGAGVTNLFARRFLKDMSTQNRPFFLFLNYMDAHAPYVNVPRRSLRRFLGTDEIRAFRRIEQDRQKHLTGTRKLGENQFDLLRRVYDSLIHYLDSRVGEILHMLKGFGLFDDTIVVVTSDHGDLIGEHGLVHHSYAVYEELIRVPLSVKAPGRADNAGVSGALVTTLDVLPTVLDLADIRNAEARGSLQGQSLLGPSWSRGREAVFVECERPKNEFAQTYPDFDFTRFDRQLLAVRTREHKYIWASDGRHEMYDLTKDPAESNNLYSTHGRLAARYHEILFEWYGSFEKASTAPSSQPVSVDKAVAEHLRALGYF